MKRSLSLLAAIPLLVSCLYERPPSRMTGEIERLGPHFIVTDCDGGRTYELRLIPAAFVNLDRRVAQIEAETPGPVLVELGGRRLPAASATAAEAIFDVHTVDGARPGACP